MPNLTHEVQRGKETGGREEERETGGGGWTLSLPHLAHCTTA